MKIPYSRVLIKLSGESLSLPNASGIDPDCVKVVASELSQLNSCGLQVAIVVGGGNLWRGARGKGQNLARVDSDKIGMVATIMNALALKNSLESLGINVLHQSALPIFGICQGFDQDQAKAHLEHGGMVLFSAGTGQPFFSTDTASALRAAQIQAQAIFKATQVDGIYDQDPRQYPEAERFSQISFTQAIEKQLRIMDATAFEICRQAGIEIRVFKQEPGSFMRALTDPSHGSTVKDLGL